MEITAIYTATVKDTCDEIGKELEYCEVSCELTIRDKSNIDNSKNGYILLDDSELTSLVEFLKAVGRK